jgi:lincosamide nucleotidyltransferase A/C/D/E
MLREMRQPGDGVVTLTFYERRDAPMLCEADHDPEHRGRFDFPDTFVPSVEHSENVIARWERERHAGTRFAFAVRSAGTGELLGGCELRPLGDGAANLSYWTCAAHRRRGVASRAVALACNLASERFGFRRLEVVIDRDNTGSRRVAANNRFIEAGEREGRVLHVLELRGEASERMKPGMTAEALLELLRLLESAGIEVWLDGGWAVDAALGEPTRPHKDVDIIVRVPDLPILRETLGRRGFEARAGGTGSNFVLADGAGLEVDVHAIVFDREGNGVYRMENGSDWIFPAAGFSGWGVVQGLRVRCLTPEIQVLCHAHGYVPAEKDFDDMERLRARFGVELPPRLRRPAN